MEEDFCPVLVDLTLIDGEGVGGASKSVWEVALAASDERRTRRYIVVYTHTHRASSIHRH